MQLQLSNQTPNLRSNNRLNHQLKMSASSTEKPDAPANRAELLRALTTAQYASGLAFATFGALHVANHLIVPIVQRIGEADRVMSFFR